MNFVKLDVNSEVEKEESGNLYLVEDNWNDWWEYKTLYQLYYKDSKGEVIHIGGVKIGQKNMEEDQMRPNLNDKFLELSDDFFSLGEDIYYYENLNRLGDEFRDNILTKLNDIALDRILFKQVEDLRVSYRSILRDKTSKLKKLVNLAKGNSILTPYNFEFKYLSKENEAIDLAFYTEPNSFPPTNVHVLIGRNGVGKTYLINNMIFSIMNPESEYKLISKYEKYGYKEKVFENIMYISFSAFDGSRYITNTSKTVERPAYTYIGLKSEDENGKIINKDTESLMSELMESIWNCREVPSKRARLRQALLELNVDPIFNQSEVIGHLNIFDEEFGKISEEKKLDIKKKFLGGLEKDINKLSSGHSIILLTICRLIEELEEKTLVLLDEPESHLHPPLLSTFTRILSNLLFKRNGVGIIATHSPVILQEVPKDCVYILDRNGYDLEVSRPINETYGENINTLTKEVFSFELTHAGFHGTLVEIANKYDNYEDALNHFGGNLGLEAKAILRNLIKEKDS